MVETAYTDTFFLCSFGRNKWLKISVWEICDISITEKANDEHKKIHGLKNSVQVENYYFCKPW